MARLIVNAISEDTIASAGNRHANYIIVSVTDSAAGAPISGLTAENFDVDSLITGPGGILTEVVAVAPSPRMEGYYRVDVVPREDKAWKAGVYIFGIAVTNGTDKGQTLCSVRVDK